MRLKKELTNIVEKLESVLSSKEIEAIAKSSNFVKRKSYLSGCPFLYLNMEAVGSQGFNSLTESCMKLSKDHDIELSKQGLDNRYQADAVKFMSDILSKVLHFRLDSISTLDLGVLGIFKGIYLRDATSSQLPECFMELFKGSGGSASKSGIKVELQYNLIGEAITLDFRNGASSDSTAPDNEIEADSLYLQDLGYFKIGRFREIIKGNAYFISRYKNNVNIYFDVGSSKKGERVKEKPIKLKTLTKGMKVNEVRSKQVYLGIHERLPVRLVFQKLPKKVADKRKRKLKEDNRRRGGNMLSQERLKAAEYNLFITNLEVNDLTDLQIIQTYKIRWQIEIIFKCWKSVMLFGKVHPMKHHRFLCMLYGQMIWIALTMKIIMWFKNLCQITYKIELSELKCFKLFKIYQNHFTKVLISNKDRNKYSLDDFIQNLFKQALLFAEKEYKKNNPNPLFTMN